ncbi:MAG: PorV/PorQ family protein [Elusimicrobiota bacterium]
MKKTSLTLLIFFLFQTLSQAGVFDGAGTTNANFLKIPLSGRAAAMSGAYTAIDGDISAIEYNPAGLSKIHRTDVLASYTDYFEGVTLQSIGVGFPMHLFGKNGPWNNENPWSKVFWGINYRGFQAKDEERTILGAKRGEFSLKSQTFQVGAAVPVSERLSLGLSGRYLEQTIQNISAKNFALDTGAIFKLSSKTNFGVSLINFGSSTQFQTESDPLPTALRSGITSRFGHLLLSLDVIQTRDSVLGKALGAEYNLGKILYLRAGVQHDTSIKPSGGIGLRLAGPEKGSRYLTPSKSKKSNSTQKTKDLAADKDAVLTTAMDQMARDMTLDFKNSRPDLIQASLAVFPFQIDDPKHSKKLTTAIHLEFFQTQEYTLIEPQKIYDLIEKNGIARNQLESSSIAMGKSLGAELIFLGSVEQIDERLLLAGRIVSTETGKILATSYQQIPKSVMSDSAMKIEKTDTKNTPEQDEPNNKVNLKFENQLTSPNRVEFGLDYGLRNEENFGIIHSVSLRIIY